ncbi:hypothetical protein DIURU_005119 [Diutina rugosa]|uniref:Serine aminopeptidase S33 domain-containing protein n=1 Tax=Diutina rugosa TaxID=5481 RepID=A0A642UIV3_DIURU|nr:uncharacterized protein DIURU_005119 [Diutina rugosa]KAA8897688.1 hypothetical protein DIURU_005119 [Diutina rugosa]
MEGRLIKYTSFLTAFEYGTNQAPNVIVWVGGLGDGLGSLPYLAPLSQSLPESWSVIQPLIKSSYQGWAQSSLEQDLKDLKRLVHYLKHEENRSKVVLAGHSTGSQDVLAYLINADADEPIDGGILQGGVSDVEAMASFAELTHTDLQNLVKEVESTYPNLSTKEVLPPKFTKIAFSTPISSARFVSIAKERGTEDFFSTYLTAEDHAKTFGKVKKPLLVLYGEQDEYVDEKIDKNQVLGQFQQATDPQYWSPLSHVVPGASHKVESESAQKDLIDTVIKFVKKL